MGSRLVAKRGRMGRVGRWILIAVSAAVALNGAGWFFVGPSLATFEQDTGIQLAQFEAAYPAAAHLLALQARNTAILLMGIGLMSLIAFTSSSHVSASSGLGAWLFGFTLAGVGASELAAGAVFGLAYLTLGIVALLGQMLSVRVPSS